MSDLLTISSERPLRIVLSLTETLCLEGTYVQWVAGRLNTPPYLGLWLHRRGIPECGRGVTAFRKVMEVAK
jgi:hypothetical protein